MGNSTEQLILGQLSVVYQQYNLCICIEPHVSCPRFHLQYTFNGMLMFLQEICCNTISTLFTQNTDYWWKILSQHRTVTQTLC